MCRSHFFKISHFYPQNVKDCWLTPRDSSRIGGRRNRARNCPKITWSTWHPRSQRPRQKVESLNRSFACYVIASMLVDDNKRFLISFYCSFIQHGRHVFVIWFRRDWLQTIYSIRARTSPAPHPTPLKEREAGCSSKLITFLKARLCCKKKNK